MKDNMLKGIFVLSVDAFSDIYGQVQEEIRQLVEIIAPPRTSDAIRQNLGILRDVDLLFTGWGGPRLDETFLQTMPNLKAVFYGGGGVPPLVEAEILEKKNSLTLAAAAHAVAVCG